MLATGYNPGFQTREINHSSASTLLELLRRNLNSVLRTGRTLPSGKLALHWTSQGAFVRCGATASFEGVARTFREQRRGCTASTAGTAFSGNFESYPGTLHKISGLR